MGSQPTYHLDLVTLGETMLRLTPPASLRLEQTPVLEVGVGGTESNTAVGLARLGLRVAWISRLPDTPLGRRVAQALAAQGVDTAHVVWASGERLGLYFLEPGTTPRATQVLYDRTHSAMSRMRPDELPQEPFRPGAARHLHLTGITLALGKGPRAVAWEALQRARAAGMTVSFDVNYRARLWSPSQAQEACRPFLAAADLVILPRRDAHTVFQAPKAATPEELLTHMGRLAPEATVVLTLGPAGAIGQEPGQPPVHQPAYPTSSVDRIGVGDAFSAGLLFGYLGRQDTMPWLPQALRWASAMAALKFTIPGDLPLVHPAEVQALVEQGPPAGGVER